MDICRKKMSDKIKRIVTCDTLLTYTDFNKRFDIHMDAIEFQLGAVIIHTVKKNRLPQT